MTNYYTPGVYVEEISTLPPSVVDASTAIPAFLGYTERTEYNGVEQKLVPTRISTMLEFRQYFGGPAPAKLAASVKMTDAVPVFDKAGAFKQSIYTLYYALDLFFKNGGNFCYIVSLGKYNSETIKKDDFTEGLTALEKEDEPTLLVVAEACGLKSDEYYSVCKEALKHCAKVKNRFCILDVKDETKGVDNFRTGVGQEWLKYGAAYYPYLKTTISARIDDADVTVTGITGGGTSNGTANSENAAASKSKTILKTAGDKTLTDLQTEYTGLYAAIKNELTDVKYKVVLPASAAIAGVFAAVDRDRGVWKAPANVSLNGVIEPLAKITATEQENLNVHAGSGKSINAIRSFTGKGIVVWGARTLAGNDNEWRYVSVRRLFNMIEDSCSKASAFAVFEPNDPTTWLKVQSMLDSYLYGLWQQGALVGPTAKAAYFVKVGLGSTMTNQDVLEGRMIVEIGVAAVRPAEFIVLRFSHKLQEA